MFTCKCNCSYIAIIVGILFGFLVGVLVGFGILPAVPLLAVAFLLGAAGVLLLPIYSALFARGDVFGCFCQYRRTLAVAAVGIMLAAFVTYAIFFAAATPIPIAIGLGITAFFAALLVGMLICVSGSFCGRGQ